MAKQTKIAYSPYYEGLMIWRKDLGCSSFFEKEFPDEASAKWQLKYEAKKENAEILPSGALDSWPAEL